MKRKSIISLFIASLFILSCENSLVPAVNNSTASTTKQLLPPENITAVSGNKKITLMWSTSQNATHYSIYAAPTQFDKFVKIGESAATSYTYNVGAGLTRYFKIVAENGKNNTSSDDSLIAKGFTLAQPKITSIDSVLDNNDSVNTVYWYMTNLEDYQEYIQYEIRCFNGNQQIKEVFIDGKDLPDTRYTFTNLPQNKTIQFEIEAYLSNEQSVSEKSARMDIVTAARQTPDPVTGLKASHGIAKDKIELEFELPDYSYVKDGNDFIEHALYFKIFRREQRNDGTEDDWGTATGSLYYNGQTKTKPDVKDYIPGNICKYEDENLKPGKKYEYKIQSYVQEDTDSEITSPTYSVATTMGWTCGLPLLMTDDFEYEYEYNPDNNNNEKISATLDFKASWNNFGNESEYKFLLESKKTKKNEDTNTEYKLFSTTKEIDEYKKDFNLNNDSGTYRFTLYVVKAEGAAETADCAENALVHKEASGEILVSKLTSLPKLTNFTKDDGYKDKVILSWDDEQKAGLATSYNLLRYVIDSNGYKTSDDDIEIKDVTNGLNATDGKFTYTDESVESGKRYKYTLVAYVTSEDLDVPSTPIIAETLGTPVPHFDKNNPKHDKIVITWDAVLQADDDSYTVELKDGEKISTDEIKITKSNETTFTCEIPKPDGYDDATKSGKEWTAVVTAKSKKEDSTIKDTTEGKTEVRTLGPFCITPKATVSESTSQITVTWKKIPGAKRYAIIRTRYEVTDKGFKNPIEDGTDIYYVTATGGISGSLDKTSATILLNNSENTFTLTDTSEPLAKTTGASSLQINQDRLAWGYPYRYTIIPLEKIDSEVDDNGAIISSENLKYQNINEATATGSCRGYGHNVRATKAEDPYEITITWDEPYGIGANAENAKLYYKKEGDESWKLTQDYTTTSFDSATHIYTFTPSGNDNPRTGTYLFAIGYGTEPCGAYFEYSTDQKDTNYSPTESLNKGYTYSLDLKFEPVIENGAPSLNEKFAWTLWDYKKRAIGPAADAKIELQLYNNDFVVVTEKDDGWRTIAEIDKDGKVTPYDETKNPKYNVAFTSTSNTSVQIKPKALKDADHQWYNGLLKVQRDYKHYAKLKCDRETKDENEKKVELSWADKDNAKGDLLVYGYRNFTDGEIARMAMLIFSYGFYYNGGGSNDISGLGNQYKIIADKEVQGATCGNFHVDKSSYETSGKHYATFHFRENYNCEPITPGGKKSITPFGITTIDWVEESGKLIVTKTPKPTAHIKGTSDFYVFEFNSSGGVNMTTKLCNSTGDFKNDYQNYPNLFDATINLDYWADGEDNTKTFRLRIKRGVIETNNSNANKITNPDNGGTQLYYKQKLAYDGNANDVPKSEEIAIMSWCPLQIHPDQRYRFTNAACDWWGGGVIYESHKENHSPFTIHCSLFTTLYPLASRLAYGMRTAAPAHTVKFKHLTQ